MKTCNESVEATHAVYPDQPVSDRSWVDHGGLCDLKRIRAGDDARTIDQETQEGTNE